MKRRRKGNLKRVLSVLLASVMVLSWMSESALALTTYASETGTGQPEALAEESYSVTVKVPANWDTSVHIYIYSGSINNGWPGVAMTNMGGGTYSYTFREGDVEEPYPPRVMFSDGSGTQYPGVGDDGIELIQKGKWTINITDEGGYTIELDHLHDQKGGYRNDGSDSTHSVICSCGKANTEGHTAGNRYIDNGDGTHSVLCICGYAMQGAAHIYGGDGRCTACGVYEKAPTYEIYAVLSEQWNNVCCYAYDGVAPSSWPGDAMTNQGNDIWHYTLNSLKHPPRVLFSSGGGEPRYPADGVPGLELTFPGTWIFEYDGNIPKMTQHSDSSHVYRDSTCVACGALEARPVTVTVTANETSWGVVSGSGSYTSGDTVTVTAKANPGYKFVRWTENGKEVSTNAEYTFTATYEDKTLTAVFAKKKISVRSQAVKGSVKDVVTGGTQTDLGATHTITVTPYDGYRVIEGYFSGTDYYASNPKPYTQYKEMTLKKLSTDPDTGAVTYQFTATECIPVDNDSTYDYICLYFHCAKAPTYSWFLDTVYGEAAAPSPDGSVPAVSYESQYDLCADPGKTGYYQLANAKDRAYLSWDVESVTNADDPTEKLNGTVRFENNRLHYTPTFMEAGKTVQIQVRPKLGDGLKAQDILIFEIEVKYSDAAKIKDVSATLNDVRTPEAMAKVQDTVQGGNHYTASLSWSPEVSGVYDFNIVYTATLALTPEPGYSLHSIDYTGWKWKQGTSDGGAVIYKTFPATQKEKITFLDSIEDVNLEEHIATAEEVIAGLPTAVMATTETGTVSMPISWSCENYDTKPDVQNTFVWTVTDAGSYDTGDMALSGSITVTNPSALPVSITGMDKEVTYNGGVIDVSELFTIDENAGEAAYSITGGTGTGAFEGSILTVTKAGTFTITVRTQAQGIYAAETADASLTVNPKILTPHLAGVTEKIYDSTADVPDGLYIELDGVAEDDDVTAGAVYSYDSPDAGNRTITAAEIVLSGEKAGNYILSGTTATIEGIIHQAVLGITASDQTIAYSNVIDQGIDYVMINGLKGKDVLDSIVLTAIGNQVSEENSIVPSNAVIKNGKKDVTANYQFSYQPGRLIIERLAISVPMAISLIYNGKEQIGVESGTGYTIEGNTGVNVDIYTATATLDSNHCWEDGSVEAKEITWSIAPAKMENIKANGYTGVYDGNAHGITVTDYPSGVTVWYGTEDGIYDLAENPTYTGAGIYTVYYRLTSPNYETVIGSATVTIERKAIDYPVAKTGLVYNGKDQNGVESGEGYALDNAVAKNAGSYVATAVLNDNYKWSDDKTEDAAIDWKIEKKEVTASITANGGVYNGESFPALVKLEGVVENETVIVTLIYTKKGEAAGSADAPKDAGTYTVTAMITDNNYNLTALSSKNFTITRAGIEDAEVTVDGSYTYTGTAHMPDPTVMLDGNRLIRDTDYTVSYSGNVNAGTATVTVTGIGNYTGKVSGVFTIAPKPVTVTILPGGGVYGGAITEASATLNGVVTGDTAPIVTLTYTGKANDGTEVNSETYPIKAGIYTVTASIPEGNYTLTGTTTVQFQVERAESALTVTEVIEKTYGDDDFTLEVTTDAGRNISYESSNQAVAMVDETGKVHIVGAGEVQITITLAQNDNFQGKELVVSLKIAKKPIRVTAKSVEVTYGEPVPELTYTVAAADLIGEDTLTGISVVRQKGEDAGDYMITFMQEEGANPNYDIEFVSGKLTIWPKDIGNAEIVLGPALIANGKKQTQTLESVIVRNNKGEDMEVTYTITGNTAVNAGGYIMTITGTGNFTGTKEQSFAIAPGAGQPVETDINGNPVLGAGKIAMQVIPGTDAPAVDMGSSKAEIIELLTQNGCLTVQELAQAAGGMELKIVLTTSGSVSADDQSLIKSLANGYMVGSWFDISLYKQLGEGDIVWLHETGKPIRLTVQVPDNLINTDKNVTRTFWLIRCHDGKAEFLPAQYDDSSKTLSFESDRFSSYAIVYKDAKNTNGSQNIATGKSPKTGDNSRVALWLAMMAMSAMGLGIVLNASRKKKKTY
mgnify:CR=1 FL=1